MASTIKNVGGKPVRIPRGRPADLGAVTSNGDVVAFTIADVSHEYSGYLMIQTVGGTTPTFALEWSIDGGVTWSIFPTVTTSGSVLVFALTGQPGSDTAATFAAQYNVRGMGAGAQFRFGRTDANGGAAEVWALVG